jgi:hypothetical protein
MMKCEDCIHYEICSDGYEHIFGNEHQDKVETVCKTFKDKSRFIELPCKVGDTVYCVYAASGIQEWEVFGIETLKNTILFLLWHKGTEDYNAAYLSEVGKYLFFTREEAEKRLKELQNG